MRLGSCVAVAVAKAGGYSSDSTPSLGTSVCCRYGPQKTKKTGVGKICAKHLSGTGLTSKIYKKFIQLSNNNDNNTTITTHFENGQRTSVDILPMTCK